MVEQVRCRASEGAESRPLRKQADSRLDISYHKTLRVLIQTIVRSARRANRVRCCIACQATFSLRVAASSMQSRAIWKQGWLLLLHGCKRKNRIRSSTVQATLPQRIALLAASGDRRHAIHSRVECSCVVLCCAVLSSSVVLCCACFVLALCCTDMLRGVQGLHVQGMALCSI